ncbi:hypothetical protein LR48_Vigan2376s000100 [Vigna angularis]|nr:hypothetical protein LR48_Vigan2376s000100 [Vigna angularis]
MQQAYMVSRPTWKEKLLDFQFGCSILEAHGAAKRREKEMLNNPIVWEMRQVR